MLDYQKIGQQIRAVRRAQGLSQEQLAEKVWISTTHMSHIETGQTKLSLPVLVDLANALQVSPNDLLCSSDGHSRESSLSEINKVMAACTPAQVRIVEQIVKATVAALTEQA